MNATRHEEFRVEFLARVSIDWLEDGLRYHKQLQAHGKATPVSIARHEVQIVELRAEIARRRERPTLRPLPALPRREWTPLERTVRSALVQLRREQFRLVTP